MAHARRPWIADIGKRRASGHIAWLGGAIVLGFAISFIGADRLALPRDGFVLAQVAASGAYVAGYLLWSRVGWRSLVGRLWLGLAAAAIAGAFSLHFVLSQPGSPGPGGAALIWSALWLGVAYGAVDALLLTVLPVLAVWHVARRAGWLSGVHGWAAGAALALAASLAVTAAYHLGFPEFRGASLLPPLFGNAIFSLAYLASGSAAAPVLSHIALHVAALVHALHTSVPLPPHY